MLITLGLIAPTPGTPLDILQNRPDLRGKGTLANSLYYQVHKDNTGDVYIGKAGLNRAAETNIITVLRPPTANFLTDNWMEVTNQPNPYLLDEIFIDVDVPGDSVRVTAQ